MAWVSSRIVDTWCPDNVDRPSEGGGLNNVGQVNPYDRFS